MHARRLSLFSIFCENLSQLALAGFCKGQYLRINHGWLTYGFLLLVTLKLRLDRFFPPWLCKIQNLFTSNKVHWKLTLTDKLTTHYWAEHQHLNFLTVRKLGSSSVNAKCILRPIRKHKRLKKNVLLRQSFPKKHSLLTLSVNMFFFSLATLPTHSLFCTHSVVVAGIEKCTLNGVSSCLRIISWRRRFLLVPYSV